MMYSKNQLQQLANTLFNDKLEILNRRDQEIELIKFREGVAPESPSFIVNQKKAIDTLRRSYIEFYEKSLSMNYYVVVSNYGNGKSHILNFIKSHLSQARNNLIFKINANGQNSFDFISTILEKMNREVIRKAIKKNLKLLIEENNEDKTINNIVEKFNISKKLSNLLYFILINDVEKSMASLDILTTQDDSKQICDKVGIDNKKFDFNKEIRAFFYLLMKFLKNENYYIIFLIEEFEHTFKWKKKDKNIFFEQLKEFINRSVDLGNLFIMLFATNIFNDEIKEKDNKGNKITEIDRAVYDRLKGKIIKLDYIKNEEEVMNLTQKVIDRYNKFYDKNIQYEEVQKYIPDSMNDTNYNYREYIQKISELMEKLVSDNKANIKEIQFVNISEESYKVVNKFENNIKKELLNNYGNKSEALEIKRQLIEAIKIILENNEYKSVKPKLKSSFITATPKGKRQSKLFYIAFSSILNSSAIFNKLKSVSEICDKNRCDKNEIYFIYLKDSVSERFNKKIMDYNPGVINTICLENDDLIKILTLASDKIPYSADEKSEISKSYARLLRLEVEE